jgi:hypothetical protein
MDVLASMLAYLTAVTGIVGALGLSAFLFFAAPNQPVMPLQGVTKISAANSNAAGLGVALQSPPARTAPRVVLPEKSPPTTNAETAAASAKAIAEARQAQLSAAELRRMVQEQRAKRWAYQDPDFESRFMSYAD